MAIKQTINFNSENQYFAGFLQNLIDESEIKANVSFKDNKITLILDDKDKSALENLEKQISTYLPHSIFLGEVSTSIEDIDLSPSEFTSKTYNISPCHKCLELITDPSSPSYLDDTVKCNHYSNQELDTEFDSTLFSPHYSKNSCILVTDSSKIDELFIMTKQEKKALFSIEKPTIKVTILDESIKNLTGKTFINVKAPYSVRSNLVALNAKESDVTYLFFQDTKDLNVVIVQKNTTIIYDNKVSSKLEALNENKVLNRFLNISKEAKFDKLSIGANLSHTNSISFIVSNEVAVKEVIKFQEFDIDEMLSSMKIDPIKSKLLTNLESKFPNVYEKLQNTSDIDLYETLCILLELEDESFETLGDKALEFRGNGGLKIDTQFTDTGFDYNSFVGSVVSFKLAGVDTHFLAYSIFEAFGDMAITTLNQLKSKFKCNNFVMMGDMFQNSVLYSRILSKFQLSNPYFSKSFAIND